MDAMLSDMSDQQVYRMYRMSREYLHELHEELAPHLRTQHPEKGIASSGHYTTTSQRMLIGLRLIFGAKYQDVEYMLKPTCYGKVYDALWRTVDAIRFAFDGRWDFPVPPPRYDESFTGYMDLQDTIKAYDQLEQRNAATSKGQCWRGQVRARYIPPAVTPPPLYARWFLLLPPFLGRVLRWAEPRTRTCLWAQVGALDGCLIKQQSPGVAVEDPKNYFCQRKASFSLLLMAIADADRRILWFDISMAPTSHDSLAFKSLPFAVKLLERMPPGYFISGDAAFRPGGEAIMTPGGTDAYNYMQVRGNLDVWLWL